MPSALIVKVGSTMPELAARRGDYEDWIAAGLDGVPVEVCRVRDGDALPSPEVPRAVVVTGSSALVTDREPWSEATGRWLLEVLARGTPFLGICYGHQLLAHALGGVVGATPRGREIGTIEVELTDEGSRDPLFEGLGPRLVVSASHRQSVLRLPEGARRLAGNALSEHQAYAVGERAWGVQFHPEWDHEVVRAYVEARRAILAEEGLDPDALARAVRPSAHGAAILARFARLI
ncbi:MAG: glutamine amidotransferase [Sandaracinaceae bacterium]|nr:glutamine amidotransferase [Sandaracinaceae bacterium]